jgi:hypothetical protein
MQQHAGAFANGSPGRTTPRSITFLPAVNHPEARMEETEELLSSAGGTALLRADFRLMK